MTESQLDSNFLEIALNQILPEKPLFTSKNTTCKNFFFAYYEHNAYETTDHTIPIYTLEIIDNNSYAPHQRRLGDRKFSSPLQKGDTFFCPENVNHKIVWDRKTNFTLILLHPQLFEREFSCNPLEVFYLVSTQGFEFQYLSNKIKQDLMTGCPFGSTYSDAYALTLACEIVKQLKLLKASSKHNEDELSKITLKRIKQFVQMRVESGQDISLQEMASLANMNQRNLSRFFRNSTGMLPIEYYNQQRLERAKKLLENSEYTINYIAQICGFTPNYFSRYFHKVVGLTPRAFRQEFKSLWFD